MPIHLNRLALVAASLTMSFGLAPTLTATPAAAASVQSVTARVLAPPSFLKDAARGRPLAAATPVTATVVLASRNAAGLASYADSAATPGSPTYHHWLTPQQVLTQFGPTAAARTTVVNRLTAEGFHVAAHTWTLSVSGSAKQWSTLLSTDFRWYHMNGVTFRGQAERAIMPSWLAGRADGVTGLTTYAPPAPLTVAPSQRRPIAVVRNPDLKPVAQNSPNHTVRSAQSTFSQAFSVTATMDGPLSLTTGLPQYIVVQCTYNGQPDTSCGLGADSFVGSSTNTGESPYAWDTTGLAGGYLIVGIASPYALTAGVDVTIYATINQAGNPVMGAPSVTIPLPDLTWDGPAMTMNALDAEQINTLYDANSLTSAGSKATVGIIAVAPPSKAILGALADFVAANALPPSTISTVQVTQGTVPTGWASETDMDLQAAETSAPGAHVVVYADPTLDLGAFFQAVVNQPVPVVSLSLGGEGIDSSIASVVAAASAEGVTISVSSGDFGSVSGSFPTGNTPTVEPPLPSQPADLSEVTAVGGTDVAVDAATNQAAATNAWGGAYLSDLPALTMDETLWSYNATGGGYSANTAVPAWQTSFLPAGATGRGVPDIALIADPFVAGILMWAQTGGEEVGGGTSLGAPLLAGWTADMAVLTHSSLGNLDPTLYALATSTPSAYTQAESGDNGAYQITSSDNSPGTWNPLTGLGSPNMAQLADVIDTAGAQAAGISLSMNQVAMPGAVVLTASSVNVSSAVYAFQILTPWNRLVRQSSWQSLAWGQYEPPVPGVYVVRALVKTAAGTVLASPPTVLDVSTTGPGVSALSVTTSPAPTAVQAGGSFTVTAKATDTHGTAWYEFRVKTPAGHWLTTPYSATDTMTYKNLTAGHWVFQVLALDKSQVGTKSAWQAYSESIPVTVPQG